MYLAPVKTPLESLKRYGPGIARLEIEQKQTDSRSSSVVSISNPLVIIFTCIDCKRINIIILKL